MDNLKLIEQTRLAFDFIQKLYLETSYLIKELEGQLAEEGEHFILARSGGYAVTARSSLGLEPVAVNFWPLRKFAAMFVPKEMTTTEGGQTKTPFKKDIVVLYLRVILDEKNISEPYVYFGILYNFEKKSEPKAWPVKIENILASLEYNETKVFINIKNLEYDYSTFGFKGNLFRVNLYDIKSSDDIQNLLVKPALIMFRDKIKNTQSQ
jgi:hypothetical protein